jgi:hypothetical protein
MKFGIAARPIHTLQLIDKDGSFHFSDGDRERKWVWLSVASERAHDCQTAGTVIWHGHIEYL